MQNIHQFTIRKLNSTEQINLSDYEGKKILIVNVASKCGYTYQYKELQELYEKHSGKLEVIGFPCNQFLWQEPGNEEKIANFCSTTYGVTFPITEKISVKGKKQHPIYTFLTRKEKNGLGDFKVQWNFNKFLLDEEGNLMEYFGSKVSPLSKEIENRI